MLMLFLSGEAEDVAGVDGVLGRLAVECGESFGGEAVPPADAPEGFALVNDVDAGAGRTFGVPATVIAKDNRIANPDEIVVGQELTIRPGSRVHVVDKGESFWGIGRRYGLTPERLAALNGKKTSDTIYPGDILRLA